MATPLESLISVPEPNGSRFPVVAAPVQSVFVTANSRDDIIHPSGQWSPNGYVLKVVGIAAAYFLGGRLGLTIPLTSGNISPVWPPSGIALAALLVFGQRCWPAIALGAFLVNFFTPIPHLAALVIAVGNTAGPVCGAWLLRRIPGFQVGICRFRDLLGLVVLGGLAGTAISATLGTSVLFLAGVNAWGHFGAAWLMWWLGDAMGVLIITPLVLALPRLFPPRGRRRPELAVFLLAAVITCLLIFNHRIEVVVGSEVLVLGLVPFLLWGAMRFELGGTAVVNLLIAAIAVWETSRGRGPLARNNPLWSAALLQSFLGFIVVPGMALATVVAERTQAIREQAAQAAAQQSERRYGGILETSNEGIWMLDSQFRTKFVNRAAASLLGYRVEEMIGRSLFDFVFVEDVPRKQAELERRRRGLSEQLENRYRREDGSELRVRVSTAPIFSPEGKFEGAVKWFMGASDKTDRDMDGRSALEIVMLLSRAVQQTTDSIMITDNNGIIEYVNPAFEAVTGFTQQEALGKTPRIVKSGRQGTEFYKKLWDCISEGKPFRGMLVNRKKTGELYWGEQTITPILDEQGSITHFVSVVRDVTDARKRQEQELQLRLAREVQQRFYAPTVSLADLDIAAAAYPADETGGDYFDVIAMPDKAVYVGIGDISGHGLGSALVMALMRAYVRSFAEMDLRVGEILWRVNRMLMADLQPGQFATLLLARIGSPHDSLTYASAGHVPAFLLNSRGEIDRVLDSTGVPLGLFESSEFSVLELRLKPGQTLVLVTDGITECTDADDRDFGSDGIKEYLRVHHHQRAREIAHGLCQATHTFAGSEPQRDDLTSVVVKLH